MGRETTPMRNGTSRDCLRPGGGSGVRLFISVTTLRFRHLRTDPAGVSTNNSVEATVRVAGNLGFETYLVADACFTFARRDFYGRLRAADEVHAMSLANLDNEYCKVLDTAAVLAASQVS